jgi:hypothetical protein
VFDAKLELWLSSACAVANRNLTQNEWEQFIGLDQSYERTCPQLPA